MEFLTKVYHAIVDMIGFGAFVVVCLATPLILTMLAVSLYFRRRQTQEARFDDRRNSLDLLEQGKLQFVRSGPLRNTPQGSMPPMIEGNRGSHNTKDPRTTSIDVALTMDMTQKPTREGTVASPVLSSERFYEAHEIESFTDKSE